ncbi:alpha/beta hydrolase-fold protein [Sphingosinicella rhizophila]|uniref:Alpha/beta hydrolase-fold protein n=1 Tax=Sphingosinicella rhizophila TaxID=3050082 RepID=A0ABU3QA96_9SPHN|nr:alpha/beta hydrolase-fold protein [Sphingosinicella sp. GR2756]MDT9600308.1 alpha/beta hydrolase-fold protein [Sphingosinicella sp. GR2756]
MIKLSKLLAIFFVVLGLASAPAAAETSFKITLPASAKGPVTGRLIVVASRNATPEPRRSLGMQGPPGFAIDVEGWKPGSSAVIDGRADSYPVDLASLPAGDYHVQALLIKYTFAKRADGHNIWVPISARRVFSTEMGGNLFSKPVKVRIDPAASQPIALALTETVPPNEERVDTPWLKHVRIKSKILSDFWGVPMYIGASALLPRGFAEHPNARYPVAYTLGHGDAPFSFSTDPADNSPAAQAGARDANVKTGYEFAQEWQSDNFPRFVAITLEVPSPYFVEAYGINSANNGPYGDALMKELLPYLEREFRLIQKPYGRIVEGASTGGWEALALQLHYPDYFGGAWIFNPDPIDFTRYQLVDIYKDPNMFDLRLNDWFVKEIPFRRSREGQPLYGMRDLARLESLLGSKGRSFYQLGIWQAVHGPVGPDGYPVPLFDPKTGVIDKKVAAYMRDNGYDLSAHVRKNWPTIGPKLSGKLNFFAGEQDDFFLNLAVYKFEEMIREVGGAGYPIRFEYGRPKKGHNWHHKDWAGVVREMADHVRRNAPAGEDVSSWNY